MSATAINKTAVSICCTSVDDARHTIKNASAEDLRACLQYLANKSIPKKTLTKLINARLKQLEKPLVTVTFEDHGQDFLEWDIQGSKVVGCRPSQGSIWCGMAVLNTAFNVGDKVSARSKDKSLFLEVKYPITKVVYAK